jgi:hypothetical protein
MNDIKVGCIDSRRNAITSSYNVKDPGTLKMIDDYFKKVEEFAKDCKDVMDFETKFAQSELSKEYADLFSMVMQTEPDVNGNMPVQEVEEEYTMQQELEDDAKRAVRRRAREDTERVARGLPVIGDAMTAKQHFDLFSKFRRKKDK